MIGLIEYLAVFPGAKASGKNHEIELHEILLNSMPKNWSRQSYVQGFDCEYCTLIFL